MSFSASANEAAVERYAFPARSASDADRRCLISTPAVPIAPQVCCTTLRMVWPCRYTYSSVRTGTLVLVAGCCQPPANLATPPWKVPEAISGLPKVISRAPRSARASSNERADAVSSCASSTTITFNSANAPRLVVSVPSTRTASRQAMGVSNTPLYPDSSTSK